MMRADTSAIEVQVAKTRPRRDQDAGSRSRASQSLHSSRVFR